MSEANLQPRWNLNSFAWANENRLPGFGRLLSAWLEVHRNFCEGARPNFSWEWGNYERSQIGLLADAAHMIGGLSLQECRGEKTFSCGTKREGRSDLWLRLCPPRNEKDYLCEAKYKYLQTESAVNNSVAGVADVMDCARNDAMRLHGKPEKIVALGFVALCFDNEKLETIEAKTSELISKIWDQSQKQNDLDAIAGIWMGAEDYQHSRDERRNIDSTWANKAFGVLLLANRVII